MLNERLDIKEKELKDMNRILKRIINGKAEDKSKIEVLRDLFQDSGRVYRRSLDNDFA